MELLQHCLMQVPCRWDAQTVAAGTQPVEEPVQHDEGPAQGGHGCRPGPRCGREGAHLEVCGEGRANGRGKVGVQKAGGVSGSGPE